MPEYGRHKYGTFRYGRYQLVGGGGSNSMGPHVQYRMRFWDRDGHKSAFVRMHEERLSLPAGIETSRIRANNGEWVYTQNAIVQEYAAKVRIRSIDTQGTPGEWVLGERGQLTQP